MNKKWKQLAVLSVASALVVSACGSSNTPAPQPSTPAPSTGSGTTTTPEPSTPQREKLALNFMVISPANTQLPSDKSKDIIGPIIAEKFNVDLTIDYVQNLNDFTQKLNLRLAGGDVPDMFQAGGADSNTYILDGVPADLTNLVTPEKMPNYFKYWINETEMQRYQVQDVFKRAPIPFNREQFFSHYVRKDWIDALNAKDPSLNLKVPTNYDEFVAVAKAFTFNDPDGNGRNDTYGITAAANGTAIPRDFPAWHKHGLNPGFYITEDGYFIDAASDIRLANVLDDIRDLIALGVVDPDWYLQKAGQQLDKVQQGRAGIFYSAVRDIAFENTTNSLQKKTRDTTGVDTVEFVPFNIAPDNPWSYEALPGTPFMLSNSTSDAKKERTIEILDWLAGEEGFLLTHYGEEGKHYTRNGDRIEVDPDAYKRDFIDNGGYNEIYAAIFGSIGMFPTKLGLEYVNPNETDRDREIIETLRTYKYALLGTNLAPVQGFDLSAFRAQLYVYQGKVLLEEKDSSKWPTYRAELMDKYDGKELFEGYAEQVGKALGQDVRFKWEN